MPAIPTPSPPGGRDARRRPCPVRLPRHLPDGNGPMTARPVVPKSMTITRGDIRVTIAIGDITVRRNIDGTWHRVAWFLSRWGAARFLADCGWGDDFEALADAFEAHRNAAFAARDQWYASRRAERVAS